ncbi:MAG: hypothetical protein Q8N98_03200 [bacterium]|nr:hypothetical protein [bacterium]
MKIKDIYKKFGAPPNLGRHMTTVCGVALFINDYWRPRTDYIEKNTENLSETEI